MVSLNRDGLTEKVLAGERISTDEALGLYRLPLEQVGALANARRDLAKAKSYGGHGGEIVTYIVDRNINYTNVCNVYCKFCGKISAHQCSRIQSAGISAFRRDLQNAVARSDFEIQDGWTGIHSGRRRRNSRGFGTEENFAVEN